MTYDPLAYWTEQGESYEARFASERYVEQEHVLAEYLAGLEFASVLDVGCGFGRMRALVPGRNYTGIDLSPTMAAAARSRHAEVIQTSLADYKPSGKFDLVLAVEFLMHVPPSEVKAAVHKLTRLSSRHVVTLDWTAPVDRPTAPHNFLHDYQALLGVGPFGRPREVRTVQVGRQTLHHVTVGAKEATA